MKSNTDSGSHARSCRSLASSSSLFLAALFTALLALSGCQVLEPEAGASETATSRDIDSEKARKLVSDGALLVDVRTPEEYEDRHLDGAVNMPLGELEKWHSELPDKPIVLYCRSGNRSGQALELLVEKGHDNVYNVGGINDY